MSKIDDLNIVYIEWIDSRGTHSSWTELDDMAHDPCIIKSVGYVVNETENSIHIVPHIGTDPEQGCGDMVIPKVAIILQYKLGNAS